LIVRSCVTGIGDVFRRGLPAHFGLAAVSLVAVLAVGCYRPHAVDCVLACSEANVCPDAMTCSAGLCTRGATCVLDVAAGARHSCAVVGADVECWGNNSYGQLGIGSVQSRGADGTPFVAVDLGGRRASAVAAGGRHSCALAADDGGSTPVAVCWGDDTFGQLGIADRRARGALAGEVLQVVPLGAGRRVAAIAAGLLHTCARLEDASVVCWGDNRFGQLGVVGANADFAAVDLGEPARAVSAGAYHSCALLKSGAVRCWGWNDYGQVDGGDSAATVVAGGVVTVNLPAAKAVAAGAFHTCAILETDAVSCWGQDDAGQLGLLKTPAIRIVPPGTLVDLERGRTAWAIAAGASHSCAVLDDFSVKCWGYNADGELGIGDTSNRGDDEALGANLARVTLGADPVRRLAAGANHTCAIQAAGVKCWGLNDSGRLGVGDTGSRGDDPSHAIVRARLGVSMQ